MPITYRIDQEHDVVWTNATGVLTDADLLAHKSRLINDPDFKPGLRELSDVRAVDRLEVTPNGISQFVARDKADSAKLHDHKLAIVASADVVYGMARMYQTLSDDETQHVMVFRTIPEATAWLGIG
jgi:hypothetical protein